MKSWSSRLKKKVVAGCLIINYSYVNEHFVREYISLLTAH